MSIQEFTRFGYSYSHANNVGTSYNGTGFALTSDATNSPAALAVPANCYLESIELEASSVAAGENVTIYLARDSAGGCSYYDGSTGRRNTSANHPNGYGRWICIHYR